MNIGNRIKDIRESQNLSQQDLANKLKYLNQSQISKIEKGDRKITAQDLIEISLILGVNVEDIVYGKKDKEGA